MEPDTRPIRKFWLDKARPNNGQRYPSFCANLLRKCRGVAARARLSCCTRLVPAQRTHSSCAVHAGCDGGARCVAVLGEGVDWTVRAQHCQQAIALSSKAVRRTRTPACLYTRNRISLSLKPTLAHAQDHTKRAGSHVHTL